METRKRPLSRREFLKRAGLVAGAVATSALLESCAQPTPTKAPPTSVTAPTPTSPPAVAKKVKLQWLEWITPEISEEKMQEILKAFYATDAGKNIEIERISLPFAQVRDKIIATHLAGQIADVLNMNSPWVVELAEQGILEPLNPYLESAGKDFTDSLVSGPMQPWKGQIHCIPLTSIPFLLFYNEKKLEEAGFSEPPKTWADVESMGPKLTDPAKNTYCYASGMAAQAPYNGVRIEIWPLIYQCNDNVVKDGKANMNSPAAAKALKFWVKLVNELKIYAPGVLTNLEKDKIEAFGAEQTALLWSNVAHVTVLEQRNPALKFGLAPLPEGDTYGTGLTGWNSSIAKLSKNKEAAWEFIRWLSSPEGNAILTMAAKHLPGNTKSDVSEMLKRDPRLNVPVEILKRGRVLNPEAAMPEFTNLCRISIEQIHEVVNGRKSVEEALEFANTEWDKILQKYA